MSTQRVLKKVSTPFQQLEPTAAILVVNSVDPQTNTMKVFLEAISDGQLRYLVIANKVDLVDDNRVAQIKDTLGIDLLPTSMLTGEGLDELKAQIANAFVTGDRIAVLGVFNSGKTSMISRLTGLNLEIGDLPGTTLEFSEYPYDSYVLIDTVGQVIDISKPLMVSIDFSDCATLEEKIARVLWQDAEGILATLEIAVPQIAAVVEMLQEQITSGHKIVVTGAGASALVAMEMGGQGAETGVPIMVFTNNFGDAQPISFSKGTGEEEMALARYMTLALSEGDVMIGISASGGTGFVYDALRRAQEKGSITVAITENFDTPLGKAADYAIKSNAKPEGPSSSKIQVAHLAIAHALLLSLADERGITADQSIGFMLPEIVPTKKMGIK
jgi:D-arabinose 5-phosphate isomerase GutQ/GTP-binding protein EngB required for normal cell division